MLKEIIFRIAVSSFLVAIIGCSSSTDSGEDLDISEIQEIEATGEFNEDEFFSDEKVEITQEEKLVEAVPGLEAELGEVSIEGAEDSLTADLDIAAEGGEDLFADVDLGLEEEASIGENVDVAVEDLDGVLGEDLGTDVVEGEFSAETGELSIDDTQIAQDLGEDDLFREDSGSGSDTSSDLLAEDVSIDVDYSNQAAAAKTNETSSSDLLAEDVSIDVDYSDVGSGSVATNDEMSSAQLLAEDVSIDVDYSNSGSSTVAANAGTKKTYLPVQKMKTVPYTKGGVLVNTIYFVRSGDTLRGIANKVYGQGSAVNFRIVNPHLKPGNLKVGQKVYYNSPRRSQDRNRLLTYYEDNNIPVMNYTARAGQNIRTLSEELLGHPRSWMEVWASNLEIQSKWDLGDSHRIRYWKGSAPAPIAPTLAQNNVPKIQEQKLQPKPETQQANLAIEEEPAAVVEQASLDEPIIEEAPLDEPQLDEISEEIVMDDDTEPTFDEVAVEDEELIGQDEELPMEEDVEAVAAVANPRDIARNQGGFPVKKTGFMGDNLRMGILGIALLLLLAVGFLIIRRRRQSSNAIEMESFDFGGDTLVDEQTKTQVDI